MADFIKALVIALVFWGMTYLAIEYDGSELGHRISDNIKTLKEKWECK